MRASLAVLLFLLVCLSAGPAWALRCGNRLVLSGDSESAVLYKCGDPDTTERRVTYRLVADYDDFGFCRKLWVETSKIITFCYLRSQRIELLCWTLGHSSGGSQLSLTNGMHDFTASDRTPSRPKRFKA